jgi:hypothetical protein
MTTAKAFMRENRMMRRISQGWHARARRRGSMRDRGRPRWVGVAGAAAAVVALSAAWQVPGRGMASAATLPAAEVVSVVTPFDSTANKSIAAVCPPGKRVIGGGGRVSGGQHVVLTRLEPVSTSGPTGRDSYVVAASEDQAGFTGTWALQAYAICADPLPSLQIVSNISIPGSEAFQGIDVSCPAGKFAVGAGGRINHRAVLGGPKGEVALGTIAEGGRWSARITAAGTEDPDGFADTWGVSAYAICVTPASLSDLQVVKVQSASDATNPKIMEASCPFPKRVTGGTAFSDNAGVVQAIVPDANRTRIQGIARNDSVVGGPWTLYVAAFCAS